jgi:hypothetical protein
MRLLARFGRFWLDFVVGDDWKIAAAVAAALAVGAALRLADALPASLLAPAIGVVVIAGFVVSLLADVAGRPAAGPARERAQSEP